MKDWQSQAHVKWDCKYHVVILPKYRRKVLYGRMRRGVGQILRDLCRQKDIEPVEGKAMPDHIHMLLSVPPKYSIAMTIGYLKGKSATRIHRECRFRSERVPLFRASGDHLSGCGAIRLTMLRDRANSPAWLAPARWLRGVAIGGPRPKRCPVEHPRDVTVELLAQRDGRLEEAQPGRRGVQIQLITT